MTTNGTGAAVAVREPARSAFPTSQEIDTALRLASNLAQSGFFKDARRAEEAFAKILFGRDLGLSPTAAMTNIHIVEGKPELSANLQANMVRTYRGPDGERYDYRVGEHTDLTCSITFLRDSAELGVSTFTIDDAKTAGLVRPNSPWVKYPRNMLFARAMSNGVAFHCPEVTNGLRVYGEGEISGEIENAAPDAAAPPAEPAEEVVDAEPVDDTPTLADEDLALLQKAAKGLKWNEIKLVLVGEGIDPPALARDAFTTVTIEQFDSLMAALTAASGATP